MNAVSDLIERYPALEVCRQSLEDAVIMLCDMYRKGGKLLVCGNGGSASDSEHIVGELMKGFVKKRPIDDEMYAKMKEVFHHVRKQASFGTGFSYGTAGIGIR